MRTTPSIADNWLAHRVPRSQALLLVVASKRRARDGPGQLTQDALAQHLADMAVVRAQHLSR